MQINIKEARQRFSELVNSVAHKKERIVITSRNKPKAVLVSVEDAEALREDPVIKNRRRMQLESTRKLREDLGQKGVKSDSLETLDELRKERIGDFSSSS